MTDLLKNEPEFILPFEGMEIGDSFFIPTLKPAEKIFNIENAAKEEKCRVKCFIVRESGYLGIRVWRTR